MSEETLSFQAEVSKLLDIVVHSLYSDRQIFLRELISNASDACDKLRYEALTHPTLLEGDGDFKITITVDKDAGTLTIADNGIGMNRDDLVENLGTIARSGTQTFMNAVKSQAKTGDVSLIGQFGVGFYSAFMVATKVRVVTRRAGETQGWQWISEGTGEYTIAEAEDALRGASITLHLRDDAKEFLEPYRLRNIIKTYSDHIAIPVGLIVPKDESKKADGTDGDEGAAEPERVNEASALWTRPRDQITVEQYTEFYRHVSHGMDEPWHTLHFKAEGMLEYTGLLFVPGAKPFDLFTPERKTRVKLYVNRVFITDDCDELLPAWLRFVQGVVDSSDLPLNVSRELLQNDPRLRKIKSGLTKRLVDELGKRARDDEEAYLAFWANFGAVLKEGIYEDFERKTDLLKLTRFRTTRGETPVSLESYKERMVEGQKAIYFVTGDDAGALARSPQVEGFVARGIEVLLLTDPIDEFWPNAVSEFDGTPLTSVMQAGKDLDDIPLKDGDDGDAEKPQPASEDRIDSLIGALKGSLGDTVKDVRVSNRLTDSPVCLVVEDGAMSLHLERMLRQANQGGGYTSPRVLEINPRHRLIKALAEQAAASPTDAALADAAYLLLDQARILEGEAPTDPVAFAQRMTSMMGRGFPAT